VTNEKLRLSIGAPPAQRVFGTVFGLLFAGVGATFVVLPFIAAGLLRNAWGAQDDLCEISGGDLDELPSDFAQDCLASDARWSDGINVGPMQFIGLCGLPVVLLGIYMVLRIVRTAAWLDGTTAEVRGAFGTRRVDLSTAAISVGAQTYRRGEDSLHERVERIPTLIAEDRSTGRTVTIALQAGNGGQLPPFELRALADAMTVGRSTDGRDHDVHTIAGQLRAMADNPLGF
jgi:hypothetical protein